MNTKQIGDVSEAKVTARFIELGYSVSIPFGDNDRYDIIVEEKDGTLSKVQIKTARYIKSRGVLMFACCSNNWNKGTKTDYVGDIDYFAVYSPQHDEIYVVDVEDAPSSEMTLRVEEPKKASPNTNMAKNFKLTEDCGCKSRHPAQGT